jgi:hypothetical protein
MLTSETVRLVTRYKLKMNDTVVQECIDDDGECWLVGWLVLDGCCECLGSVM